MKSSQESNQKLAIGTTSWGKRNATAVPAAPVFPMQSRKQMGLDYQE
jgi:hypothetical protein